MDVSGDYATTTDMTSGSADLNRAGLVEDEGYAGARIDLDMGVPTIHLSSQMTSHDGLGKLTGDLDVNGVAIPAEADVATALDLSVHNLALTFSVIPIPLFDAFDFGIGFGASVIQVDASIQEQAANFDTITADETIPIPTIAATLSLDLGDFEASALFSGVSLEVDDIEADFYDLDVLAQYRLFGGEDRFRGAIGVGYRSTVMDFAYKDGDASIDLEMELDGPYVALNFSF